MKKIIVATPLVTNKRTFPILALLFVSLSLAHGQTVHQINTADNALYNAVLGASDGDIIELTEVGEYRLDSLVQIDIKLTIRAAAVLPTRPILRNYHPTATSRYIFKIITDGHLTLEGLDLDGLSWSEKYRAENLIQTEENMIGSYSLYIDNCYLRDVNMGEKGSFFRAYAGCFADTVKITNSVLSNAGKIGLRINEVDNEVGYFELSNSSMFDVWGEGIYVQGSDVKFRVDHCTFNNIGYSTADILRPRFILDAKIKNSIFTNTPEPRTRSMLLYGTSTLDYCNFYEVGDVKVHSSVDFNWADSVFYQVDPQYFDVDHGDFYLTETSPLLTAADDGSMLGDPNWVNNRPFIPDTLEVYSQDNALFDSLQVARSGDIIELMVEGEYLLDDILSIDKEITIRASDDLDSKPILKNINTGLSTRSIFKIETGGMLNLEGLDIDGDAGGATPATYLISTAESITGSYKLKVEDCILHDVISGSEGSFFRAFSDTYADTIVFTNSILYNSGKEGISVHDAANSVEYFEIRNSTMYNTASEGIFVQGNEVEFIVDHCTFNNLGYAGTEMIRPSEVLNATILNTIFSNTPEPQNSAIEIFGSSVIDYCDFYNVGSIVINDETLFTIGENVLFDVNPEYADATNADFSLLETSPLYYIADDRTALGDSRWAVNAPEIIPTVRKVGLERNALYDTLMIAKEGDILELTESGEYLLDSLLFIDHTITVRAAQGLIAKPVIKMVNPDISTRHLFQINTGGNLFLSGLDLDGMSGTDTRAKYIIRTDEKVEGSYRLIVDDCILHDVLADGGGNFFRAYSETYADTVIFNNCIMYNSGQEGIRIKDSDNTVKYFELSNSTMYDTRGEAVYVQGSDVVFRVNHSTFNNIGTEHTRLLRPRYVIDSDIRNCIFSNTPEPQHSAFLLYGTSTLDYSNFYDLGAIMIHSQDDFNYGDSAWYELDPVYVDMDNGIFTLQGTSPMYGLADDGEALGDLRWATSPDGGLVYTASFTVKDENNDLYMGAIVAFNGESKMTNDDGIVRFTNVSPITDAAFSVTADGYQVAAGTVTVTDDNITKTVLISPVLGITAENWDDQIEVYPNPATNSINLKLPNGYTGTVGLFDTDGRQIDSRNVINEADLVFSTEGYNNGFYYVKISNGSTVTTKRLIIIR